LIPEHFACNTDFYGRLRSIKEMSQERYMQALRCQGPAVMPHQIWLLHPEFIRHATGVDYYAHPLQAALRFHARFDVDNGGPEDDVSGIAI